MKRSDFQNKRISVLEKQAPEGFTTPNVWKLCTLTPPKLLWKCDDGGILPDTYLHLIITIGYTGWWVYKRSAWSVVSATYAVTRERPQRGSNLDLCDVGTMLHQLNYRANWKLAVVGFSVGVHSVLEVLRPFSRYCLSRAHNCENHMH